MLTVFGAVAELERAYILERQQEGIAIAKAKGVYKGRPPPADQSQHILSKTERREKAMTEMGFFVLGFTVCLGILVVADAVVQTTAYAAK